ncbi:MAG: hypothetical protein WAQ57_01240 [Candidatus Saccharimonadales bacterium]
MAEAAIPTIERTAERDLRLIDAAAVLAIVDAFVGSTAGRDLVSSQEAADFGLDVRLALEPVEA